VTKVGDLNGLDKAEAVLDDMELLTAMSDDVLDDMEWVVKRLDQSSGWRKIHNRRLNRRFDHDQRRLRELSSRFEAERLVYVALMKEAA
jgi:hypothetical protein